MKDGESLTQMDRTELAEIFPGYDHCGSKEPLWLKVDEDYQLPSTGNWKIMQACKPDKYSKDSCKYTEYIDVMNCRNYFL